MNGKGSYSARGSGKELAWNKTDIEKYFKMIG
jgi:hypothetical protein